MVCLDLGLVLSYLRSFGLGKKVSDASSASASWDFRSTLLAFWPHLDWTVPEMLVGCVSFLERVFASGGEHANLLDWIMLSQIFPSPHIYFSLCPDAPPLTQTTLPVHSVFLMNSATHEHIWRSVMGTSPRVTDVHMCGEDGNEY